LATDQGGRRWWHRPPWRARWDHRRQRRLDTLPEGGRLLLPLTTDRWGGGYLWIERHTEGYAARFVTRVWIFAAASGRKLEAEQRLVAAFRRTREADASCWLHAPDFCLSSRVVSNRAQLDALRFV
jgi:hypothetical protein